MDIKDMTVEEIMSRADIQGYQRYLALLKGKPQMTFEEWKQAEREKYDELPQRIIIIVSALGPKAAYDVITVVVRDEIEKQCGEVNEEENFYTITIGGNNWY